MSVALAASHAKKLFQPKDDKDTGKTDIKLFYLINNEKRKWQHF